jgi:alpha-D-xyloside xylohydrolase
MILTRCGFPGIQRYGAAMWSGDVGNDFPTLRRQIQSGLGMQSAGIPWWTYDAGGFFRPGNQYSDQEYIERMLRWIEASVYLPLMRVHGYMSNTEPWNYGPEAQRVITECIRERYRLLPYIYSNAAEVTMKGSTMMRPLVFDFASDAKALDEECEYMFGRSLLVNPVTEKGVETWNTYLPKTPGGWYDFRTNQHYEGGQTVITSVDLSTIPVFAKAGSIVVTGRDVQSTSESQSSELTIHVYPGADAIFDLYDDEGINYNYEKGKYSLVRITWDDAKKQLTINKRKGSFDGMVNHQTFVVVMPDGKSQTVEYNGIAALKLKIKN